MNMGDTYQNNETYLYNGTNHYWTMSPYAFDDDYAYVVIGDRGAIYGNDVDRASNGGARPVISLLSSGITGGHGTASTPFIIGSE